VRHLLNLTGSVLAALLVLGSWSSWAADGTKVLEPGIKHFGKSYNELAGDWWNWAVQFPFATSPLNENGVVDCTRGQSGAIWFLAGNFGGESDRTCTIPSGKAIFLPVQNIVQFFEGEPEPGGVDELRADANEAITNPVPSLNVTIDGGVIEDLFAYRAQSPPGGFPLKVGPLFADFGLSPTPDSRDPAVADGYWILLAPLDKGAHEIHFSSHSAAFDLEVTYHLTVGKGDE
jgi:hypothetical protein